MPLEDEATQLKGRDESEMREIKFTPLLLLVMILPDDVTATNLVPSDDDATETHSSLASVLVVQLTPLLTLVETLPRSPPFCTKHPTNLVPFSDDAIPVHLCIPEPVCPVQLAPLSVLV